MMTLKNDQLRAIKKLFKENKLKARVGILGDSNGRNDGETNASIGAQHEFGTTELPRRSFLRLPLKLKLKEYEKESGLVGPKTLAEIYKARSLEPYFKKLGMVAERVIADAFATGGFGFWKPSRMDLKKNKQTLVETQQLRNSITSKVTK